MQSLLSHLINLMHHCWTKVKKNTFPCKIQWHPWCNVIEFCIGLKNIFLALRQTCAKWSTIASDNVWNIFTNLNQTYNQTACTWLHYTLDEQSSQRRKENTALCCLQPVSVECSLFTKQPEYVVTPALSLFDKASEDSGFTASLQRLQKDTRRTYLTHITAFVQTNKREAH